MIATSRKEHESEHLAWITPKVAKYTAQNLPFMVIQRHFAVQKFHLMRIYTVISAETSILQPELFRI